MKKDLIATVLIEKPIDEVWNHWTNPLSIKIWNIPFEDWHCPKVINNLKDGGSFFFRMEHINGHDGFDYTGIYDKIIRYESIASTCNDGRRNLVEFQSSANNTIIKETFEPDKTTPLAVQQDFTDSVLKRFKRFVEQQ
ncbi:SRPBCC domain-containing protein [Pedobacter ghigonis]|uniref:SRPBCC domain-containing protein n=1 Tax=Pedobacter ghigonis TaxID=2730403 RepID=UPI0015898DE6|nr:SRPBCC domain-containing protein [Pedobacter ghigonis]